MLFKLRAMSDTPLPDLPEPSPELILILALVQAHCRSLSKKERDRFLSDVTQALGMQQASYAVIRFRPRSADPAVYRAMSGAAAWWRHAISVALGLGE